ncbi:recombinase family protein [Yoonia sp. 2307UL14-13]|uniref:recombinase family protein n=1 Tax=Yoonia sp. 2307UL14-13 TaxID=3126506 RepID=UPI00309BBA73
MNNHDMKQCFGYIRVSTKKQEEGVSLEAQKEAILQYAAQKDLTVTQWFEEAHSAAKRGRPIFTSMMRQLRAKRAEGVIFHKIDRSVRNLSDWEAVTELPNLDIDVHIVTENIDFNSRGGRLTADLLAVFAADFIRNHQAEVKKGQLGRLKQGLYPFRAPIGYLDNYARQDKTKRADQPKRICPIKGPLIKELFDLYATGQYSIRSLMPIMEKRGLRNHADKPLSKHGIETILRNPFYSGLIVMQRSGDVYPGQHKPLITPQLFCRVQDIKSGKAGKKVTKHNHLYRGLFRCALCDAAMTPEKQKGHTYYRCQNSACPTKTVREEILEHDIEHHLTQLQLQPKEIKEMELQWQRWIDSDERHAKQQSLDLAINQTKARLSRLTDLLVDGTLSKDEYNERKRALSLELQQKEVEQANLANPHLSEQEMQKFLELMKNVTQLYQIAKPAEKRWLVENWFSNRTVLRNEPCLEPYSWLRSRDVAELAPYVKMHDPLFELLLRREIK